MAPRQFHYCCTSHRVQRLKLEVGGYYKYTFFNDDDPKRL
jgi:hypothetical protein